ncbi:flagellin lysine-N-methylase [Paenibacillus chitinolyticus]|uniref:flagellin lysine-N-methylase n=1 Tax=Paenibacillus chitinolyticus TaxID=79263 RepID=UPI0035E1A47B
MKQLALMPEYMKKFKCIGGECEDTCCAGWTVSLDKKTFKSYQKINDPTLRNKIKDGMKRIKSKDNSDPEQFYARFILKDDLCCPMLTVDKWCMIQKEIGEQALSKTCTTYPRNLNKMDGIYELSGRVSCPEVARLVLFEAKGIEFEEIEIDIEQQWTLLKRDSSERGLAQYFWPIRMLSIEIIQYRQISLGDRMVLLGLFINALQKDIDENKGRTIPDVINSYKEKMLDTDYLRSIEKIQVNLELQLQVLFELIKSRIEMGISSERYQLTFNEMMEGLKINQEKYALNSFKVNYEENFKNFYSPYMNTKEYIMENYIVNYLFNILFPVISEENDSLFLGYAIISTIYAMLKVHLVGVSGKHQGLNDDVVLRTIQSFAKIIEHNATYITSIIEELKRNNYYSLAHISLMVKD